MKKYLLFIFCLSFILCRAQLSTTLVAGTNITLQQSGKTYTVNSTGGGGSGTVTSVSPGTNMTLTAGSTTVNPTLSVIATPTVSTIQTSSITITGGATNGYILQSDANGKGSWAQSTTTLPTTGTGSVVALQTSPSFSGTPTCPTNTVTTDASTQIATDAFVQAALQTGSTYTPSVVAVTNCSGATADVACNYTNNNGIVTVYFEFYVTQTTTLLLTQATISLPVANSGNFTVNTQLMGVCGVENNGTATTVGGVVVATGSATTATVVFSNAIGSSVVQRIYGTFSYKKF